MDSFFKKSLLFSQIMNINTMEKNSSDINIEIIKDLEWSENLNNTVSKMWNGIKGLNLDINDLNINDLKKKSKNSNISHEKNSIEDESKKNKENKQEYNKYYNDSGEEEDYNIYIKKLKMK